MVNYYQIITSFGSYKIKLKNVQNLLQHMTFRHYNKAISR